MPRVSLLHFSDLHIAQQANQTPRQAFWSHRWAGSRHVAPYFSHEPDILEAAATFAWERKSDYHALLLSGDIATTGRRADLLTARAFLDQPPSPDYPLTLRNLNRPIFLLPGNHDRFRDGIGFLHALPGGSTFDHVFRPWWNARQGNPRDRAHRPPYTGVQVNVVPSVIPGFRLVLIAADFSLRAGEIGHARSGGFFGQGRVYPEPLAELLSQTGRELKRSDPERPIVLWVIHFDPTNPDPSLVLLQANNLLSNARQANVTAILVGHTHRPSECVPDGSVSGLKIIRCGSSAQCAEMNGNWLNFVDFDVSDRGEATVGVRPFQYASFDGPGDFLNVEEARTTILDQLTVRFGAAIPRQLLDLLTAQDDVNILLQWREDLDFLVSPPR